MSHPRQPRFGSTFVALTFALGLAVGALAPDLRPTSAQARNASAEDTLAEALERSIDPLTVEAGDAVLIAERGKWVLIDPQGVSWPLRLEVVGSSAPRRVPAGGHVILVVDRDDLVLIRPTGEVTRLAFRLDNVVLD